MCTIFNALKGISKYSLSLNLTLIIYSHIYILTHENICVLFKHETNINILCSFS